MTFTAIDPKSGKAKDYNNSAEFFKEVEEFTAREPEKPREVKNFKDASERIRAELGLDLRSPAEKQQAADNELFEQRVAAGVAEALEKAQQAEKAGKDTSQTPKAAVVNQSAPTGINGQLEQFAALTGWKMKPCGCKAAAHAPEAVHVARGRGPVMQSLKLKA